MKRTRESTSTRSLGALVGAATASPFVLAAFAAMATLGVAAGLAMLGATTGTARAQSVELPPLEAIDVGEEVLPVPRSAAPTRAAGAKTLAAKPAKAEGNASAKNAGQDGGDHEGADSKGKPSRGGASDDVGGGVGHGAASGDRDERAERGEEDAPQPKQSDAQHASAAAAKGERANAQDAGGDPRGGEHAETEHGDETPGPGNAKATETKQGGARPSSGSEDHDKGHAMKEGDRGAAASGHGAPTHAPTSKGSGLVWFGVAFVVLVAAIFVLT